MFNFNRAEPKLVSYVKLYVYEIRFAPHNHPLGTRYRPDIHRQYKNKQTYRWTVLNEAWTDTDSSWEGFDGDGCNIPGDGNSFSIVRAVRGTPAGSLCSTYVSTISPNRCTLYIHHVWSLHTILYIDDSVSFILCDRCSFSCIVAYIRMSLLDSEHMASRDHLIPRDQLPNVFLMIKDLKLTQMFAVGQTFHKSNSLNTLRKQFCQINKNILLVFS